MFKNLKNITKNRNYLSILLSIFIFLTVLLISRTNVLYIFDKNIWDLYFEFNDKKIYKDIIVVEIDEDTLSWRKFSNWEVSIEWLGRFPFDRKYYAKVIDNLNKAWATVIALDIIFWDKSNSDDSDDILWESIKNAGNVILWLWTNSAWQIQYPYEKFWDNLLTLWYFNANIDKVTNVLYSIIPYNNFINTDTINHFSIAVIKWFYAKTYNNDSFLYEQPVSYKDKFIIFDKLELLKSRDNADELLINYTKSSDFSKVSFLDVYKDVYDDEKSKELFNGKIVIIWTAAKWIKDIFNTPIWTEYWVYTHVNMINTILTKEGIRYLNIKLEWLLIFLVIIVSVYFNLSISWKVLFFSNISIITLSVLWIVYIITLTNFVLNYPFELLLSLIISLAISNIAKYLIENKNKNKLNKALSQYVSKEIAEAILSWNWKINFDWENQNIWILFSDIEWFTSISEQFHPEKLVSFLREYLSNMSNIIENNRGFVNKYEWDAIMALWAVFEKDENKSYNICLTALKQKKKLEELNVIWKERWFWVIKTRIGLHVWDAITWDIWSDKKWWKLEFTALWDSVNLASRLEWVNKFYWTYICVSEDVYKLENKNFEFRYLDKIRVKWKNKAIKIYELLWVKWEVVKSVLSRKRTFEKATRLYLKRDFISAREIFEKLIKEWDNAWRMYLDMCDIYIKTPPKDDWDWISTMDSK